MLCFYELGEISNAEKLFETQIPSLPPISPRIVRSVNLLIAERFFYLKRYDESREQFNKFINQKLSRRTRLEILYFLARMDEQEGNIEGAMAKYSKISSEGNKLWIAEKAREKCAGHK
jgi:tetratricopeptide (TPR) repeat protein